MTTITATEIKGDSMQFSAKLASLAEGLEKQGAVKLASTIDGINKNIVNLKYAQYVGIQNYWLHNSRCWDNCYRQKRSETPKKAAQEVWNECHEEYLEAFNKSDNGWDKYAEKTTLIKTASKGVKNFVKKERDTFYKQLKAHVANGTPVSVAVQQTINDNTGKYALAMIDEGNKLLKIAEKMRSKGKIKTAAKIEATAAEIIKEAGMWDWIKDKAKGAFRDPMTTLKKIQEEIVKVEQQIKSGKANANVVTQFKNYLSQEIPVLSRVRDPQIQPVVALLQQFAQLPNTKGSGNRDVWPKLSPAIRKYVSEKRAKKQAPPVQPPALPQADVNKDGKDDKTGQPITPDAAAAGAGKPPVDTNGDGVPDTAPGSAPASATGLLEQAKQAVGVLKQYAATEATLATPVAAIEAAITAIEQKATAAPGAAPTDADGDGKPNVPPIRNAGPDDVMVDMGSQFTDAIMAGQQFNDFPDELKAWVKDPANSKQVEHRMNEKKKKTETPAAAASSRKMTKEAKTLLGKLGVKI